MQTRENIVAQLDIFRWKIVHIMANVSGWTESQAEIIVLVVIWYVVLILLLMLIHRRLLRKSKKTQENLVLLYDTIRYQVARAQYRNPAIQESKGISVVFESEHENYLANAKAIKEEIDSIEQKLGQQIIAPEQRTKIIRQTKKKNRLTTSVQLIGRFTTLLTAGIYKLFR